MAQMNDLVAEIKSVVINAVNLHHLDQTQIGAETSLRQGGLELDSIDMLEVIVAIEQRYGVKVADPETGKKYFRSIGSIAEFVAAK